MLATSALLTGTIEPGGVETSYYFRYGATAAYGLQTPAASAGAGDQKCASAAAIAGLVPGGTYHYRVVAVNANGTAEGRDRTFKARGRPARVRSAERATDVYGTPLILTGALRPVAAASTGSRCRPAPSPTSNRSPTSASPGSPTGSVASHSASPTCSRAPSCA